MGVLFTVGQWTGQANVPPTALSRGTAGTSFWFSHQPLSKMQAAFHKHSQQSQLLRKKAKEILTYVPEHYIFTSSISACASKPNHSCKQLQFFTNSEEVSMWICNRNEWSTAGIWSAKSKLGAGHRDHSMPNTAQPAKQGCCPGALPGKGMCTAQTPGNTAGRDAAGTSWWTLKKT